MAAVPDSSADQSQNPLRVSADTPAGIADQVFCLCIYHRQRSGEESVHTFGHCYIQSNSQ